MPLNARSKGTSEISANKNILPRYFSHCESFGIPLPVKTVNRKCKSADDTHCHADAVHSTVLPHPGSIGLLIHHSFIQPVSDQQPGHDHRPDVIDQHSHYRDIFSTALLIPRFPCIFPSCITSVCILMLHPCFACII